MSNQKCLTDLFTNPRVLQRCTADIINMQTKVKSTFEFNANVHDITRNTQDTAQKRKIWRLPLENDKTLHSEEYVI